MVKALARFAAILSFCLVLPAWAGEGSEVTLEKMAFHPKVLQVKVGTTVTWVNREKRTNHSVFFEKEGLEESDRLFPGDTWQRTFDKAGSYPYRCGPHPEMEGTIEVVE